MSNDDRINELIAKDEARRLHVLAYQREWARGDRRRRPEYHREYQRQYRQRNPEKFRQYELNRKGKKMSNEENDNE